MEVLLNTLYVVTRGAVLKRDGQTVQVLIESKPRLAVPVHQLESVAVFGGVRVTPPVMAMCAERGVAVSFLTESGRLQARVDAPQSGNVLLRRAQFRAADDEGWRARLSAAFVAGKVQNSRNVVLRSARESTNPEESHSLSQTASRLGDTLPLLERAENADSIRGLEGDAARAYFAAFPLFVRQNRDDFQPKGRTRRPPLDRMNALLSFLYALLTNDCVSAIAAAGLDPSVGFLHVDRPGRPGLALDLMEEFRPLIVDRLALALVNRQQVKADGFVIREGGAVEMTDATRRTVVGAYQQRKKDEMTHPALNQKSPVGRLPFLQARILARVLRGDLASYVPCIPKN